jgi:uncharacterized protein YggE
MRITQVLLAALGLAAGAANAAAADSARGTITIVGNGEASAAPEYTTLTVAVTSICYDTSVAAKNANAELATKLVTLLKTFAIAATDKVTASGGPNLRETESVPNGSGGYQTLCTLKWKATNELSLQMAAMDRLPELQDQLLAAVDQSAPASDKVAQTYAELGQPAYHLSAATETKLRGEAQVKAYADAKAQFDVFKSQCQFQDPELTTIAPPDYSIVARSGGVDIPANAPTPLIPDELVESASWKFTWSFTPGPGCSAPQP